METDEGPVCPSVAILVRPIVLLDVNQRLDRLTELYLREARLSDTLFYHAQALYYVSNRLCHFAKSEPNSFISTNAALCNSVPSVYFLAG